jgi:uncharacterized membrane protein
MPTHPPKELLRIEFFSDALFAIIITLMALELHPPEGHSVTDLFPLVPVLMSYTLSFVYLIIYWNNHHHLMRAISKPTGAIMWANAHLLFWLSLVPFSTAWLGQSGGEPMPALLYGVSLLCPAIAYVILQSAIIHAQGRHSQLKKALGRDIKGKISPVVYVLGIFSTFIAPVISYVLYAFVALLWIVPDQRLEGLEE